VQSKLKAAGLGRSQKFGKDEAMGAWERMVENFFARLDGPLHFRFIMQPLMATIFAVIDGIKDAKSGNPPYFFSVVSDPTKRKELLKLAWKRVGKIFILAVILDVIYQLKVHHWIYPGETLIVAFVLAIVPYLLLRGPANRLARLFLKK
jgi:hypothetical protein